MRIGVIIAVFVLGILTYVGGQTCCSGGVPLANNVGGLPTMDSGSIQLALQLDLNILNTLKDENQTLSDFSRSRKTYSSLFQVGVPITTRLSLEGLFSWVRQERRIRQPGGFEDFTHTDGVGDAVIAARYRWIDLDKWRLVLGGGVKLPLGSTDHENENGILLNADLQPGTGAWDYVLYHKVECFQLGGSLINFTGNVIYRITGTNGDYLQSQAYRFGNELQLMAGIGRQVFIQNQVFDFHAGLRYRSTDVDLINGQILTNTGGEWLYGNGGISWNFSPWFSVSASVDMPLYSYVTGTQLTPTARFIFGCYYIIN